LRYSDSISEAEWRRLQNVFDAHAPHASITHGLEYRVAGFRRDQHSDIFNACIL
jgi:hypothetical protein